MFDRPRRHAVSSLAAMLLVTLSLLGAPARAQDETPAERGARVRAMKTIQRRRMFEGAARERAERREIAGLTRAAKHSARARRALARLRGARMRRELPDEDALAGRTRGAFPGDRRTANVRHTLATPQNVLANNKTFDATNTGNSEVQVAMLGSTGVSAWNDGRGFQDPSVDGQGLAFTVDGGATWTDIVYPPHPVGTQYFSDPSVTLDEKTGSFYFCALVQDSGGAGVGNGIAVVRGTISGGTIHWDAPHNARYDPTGVIGFDKEWLAADSVSGNLYLSYTTFSGAIGDTVLFQRSTDQGATWSAPVSLAAYDGQLTNNGVQGSRPAVGPNGEVYVTWAEISLTDQDWIKVAKSTNQGLSFGPPVNGALKISNSGSGAPGFNRANGIDFPSIAVDRSTGSHRGRVYLAWNESVDYWDIPLGSTANANSRTEGTGNDDPFFGARPFTIGNTLRGGISPAATDLDVWSFPASQGSTYFFYMDSASTSTSWVYVMRMFCSDTTSRLAFTAGRGQGVAGGAAGSASFLVWSPPVTGTYYLRIAASGGNTVASNYRIRTAVDTPTPAFDHARDDRDALVAWSDDGTSWSAPVRVNDDPIGYDDWLPEVAVTSEGYAYTEWFDWRDAAAQCGGRSQLYTARSVDGGATWTPNVAVTDAASNWTTAQSNIAPNQGDYLGIYGGDQVAYNWADARLGDPDVFVAHLAIGFSAVAPADSATANNATATSTFSASNPNVLFAHALDVTLTSERAWPGFPITGTTTLAAGATQSLGFVYSVPDTAAPGVNHLCLTLAQPNGARSTTVCQALTISAGALAVPPDAPRLALTGATRNPARSGLEVRFALPDGARATLDLIDMSGRRVATREVGGMGAGTHVTSFAREAAVLPAGVYAIRLSHAGRALSTKVVIVR